MRYTRFGVEFANRCQVVLAEKKDEISSPYTRVRSRHSDCPVCTSIRVRDAIIEKFIDKSLDELNNFLASALDSETDESKRIGILAARIYVLRPDRQNHRI